MRLRIRSFIRVVVFAVTAGLIALAATSADADPMTPGPFTLKSADGATVDGADLDGRPYGVMFGFTHCPDVCPTALYELTAALKVSPGLPADFRVYFVAIDPERDTPETLGAYLGAFDPRIVGLTGSPEEIGAAIQAFGAVARKVALKSGDYTMEHTAALYLINENGMIADRVSFREPSDVVAGRIAAVVGGR